METPRLPLKETANVNNWVARIERAEELSLKYPFAAEILLFYKQVASFQRGFDARLRANRDLMARIRGVTPLREQLNLDALLPELPAFLDLVSKAAPAPLAAHAGQPAASGIDAQPQWEDILKTYWENGGRFETELDDLQTFCAQAFLQPYAELIVAHREVPPPVARRMACPLCAGAPHLGVMRPEGDAAKRLLQCSFCATEWDFTRIVCPACGEEDEKKVCFYSANGFEHIRVEACDSCKTYLLSVDLTKNGRAVPVVDEIAAVPLNLWARESGYSKLHPNLMGM
jgi:FdhE protein